MATEGTRLLSRWTAQRPRCVYTLQRQTRSTTLSCPIAGITIWFFLEPSSTELPRDYIAGLRAIPFTRDPKANRKTRLEALEALRKYEESKKMA